MPISYVMSKKTQSFWYYCEVLHSQKRMGADTQAAGMRHMQPAVGGFHPFLET